MKAFSAFIFASAIFLLVFPLSAEVKIPELTGPVIDEARILSAEEQMSLDSMLRSFLPKVQMQIWTLPSLEGEPIESISIRAADKWKLGDEKKDNGIIIVVAPKDRRMRIEIGQGLEGDIPDALAGRIQDQILRPAFREGKYAAGLESAARALYEKASGESPKEVGVSSPIANTAKSLGEGLFKFGLFFIFIIIIQILSALGGPNRRQSKRSSGLWYGGSGGWGGGGGSGWSGGGGGFSGGGSSGDW
jgi:uncharacterized protein